MKTLPIDTAAAWAGTLSTIQDGDPASEATMDVVVDAIGDRLGYLKTAGDGKLALASNVSQTLSGTGDITLGTSKVILAGSPTSVSIAGSGITTSNGAIINIDGGGQVRVNNGGILQLVAGSRMILESQILPDADATITMYPVSRVPAITSNRTYTLPAAGVGEVVRIVRTVITNHSVSINGAALIATISSNSQGWIEFINAGAGTSDWKALQWGGSVTVAAAN